MFSIIFPSPGWLKRWPPRSPWWSQRRYQQFTPLLLLPCLVGVFPQLEQRVSSNIFFLIFGGAQMTRCEGGRSTPNWDLVGASILCSLLILDSCPVAPPQVSQDPNHHHQQWVQSADMMPDSHMTHIRSAFYLYHHHHHHHYHRYRIELWV